MAKHGVAYPPERRFARAYLYYSCDAVQLLALGAVKGGGLKPDQIVRVVALIPPLAQAVKNLSGIRSSPRTKM